MKTLFRLGLVLGLLAVLSSCGYRNPNVYSGPDRNIFLTEWKNRTSELDIDAKIYRSLVRWFQKSGSITVVREKAGSDLILAGEIISIDLPSLSYGSNLTATEVKVRLRVRYIVKELNSNRILLEVADETWSEDYLVGGSSSASADNETEALETIIEDLSQKIYQRTISALGRS